MINLGLSRHIDRTHEMMCRANREDGFISKACSESYSLENLYRETMQEMEAIAPCKNREQCKCKKEEAIA